LFRRKPTVQGLTPELELQVKVSKLLGIAFAFSITGLGGLGSLVAFIVGLKARRMINNSAKPINGIALSWWCIVAGVAGALTAPGGILVFVK
jgi:hypothetical protein